MIPLENALAEVRARCRPLPAEEVPLLQAHGRTLAAAVRAARDQPAQDISMMDGYALCASERTARIVGEIAAGDAPWERTLQAGEAARIFTGAPVPPGADCVVMQEHCERKGDSLRVNEAPKPGQHIRRRGEELRAGSEALSVGTALGPAELSLAAACGAAKVSVHRRPRVAILVTGEELVPLGTEPPPGKLIETNSVALAALARDAGGEPALLGIARDDPALIASRLDDATADILVTTGGASVGDHDHAQSALERISGKLVFHTVAIRPGKPILFGTSRERLVFGLPGNPAAAMLGFELFVRLAVRILSGDPQPERPRVRARLRGSLQRVKGLTYFPRGRLTTDLVFEAGGQQSSMQIASWSGVNAVAVVPPGEGPLEDGAEVAVLQLGPLLPAR
ncbi:MAG: molybdopterin molybdotransferase MoeA [Deltaproteobacteria bacterium]|nr:MAG: molybdopterin molybdotransferase MoeA [Deltaproteobacteria bacterium]